MAYRIRFSPDEVKAVDIGDSPSLGPADAPVTIVEWADFECPFCGAAAPVLDKVVRRYPGNVRLVFKCYPLSSHEHAEIAARAAVAAGRQNKFWEMHHALFEHQAEGLDRDTIERLATDIGLDMKQFKTDIESEATADAVMADRKQAEALGLRGTPMIYINGRPFELEIFSLVEDLDPWIQLDVRERTGKSVTPREVADAPAPPTASGSAAPGPSASAAVAGSASPSASAPAPVASGKAR
jgi:protein-disulfide isomerase